MRSRTPLLLALAVLVLSTAPAADAVAVVHDVTVANFSFTPKDIVVQQGDQIRWTWASGSHTVTNGAQPAAPGAGQIFNRTMDSANTEFLWTVDVAPGLLAYHCTPHWFVGMTGTIDVQPAAPTAAVHPVTVRDFEFDPRLVEATVGDTVRWIWESGVHTTTSGASSSPIHEPGALWSSEITLAVPTFDFVIPETTGVLPYFCAPHEALDMRGAILVDTGIGSVPGDAAAARNLEFRPPFPNPTGGVSTLVFHLEQAAPVKLQVFDASGRLVRTLAARDFASGYHVFRWDGFGDHGDLAGVGIYFARLRAGDETQVRKIYRAGADHSHAHH